MKILTVKMHEANQDSIVIWYDSVIQSGELKWQNELNEHNRFVIFLITVKRFFLLGNFHVLIILHG